MRRTREGITEERDTRGDKKEERDTMGDKTEEKGTRGDNRRGTRGQKTGTLQRTKEEVVHEGGQKKRRTLERTDHEGHLTH